MNTKSRIGIGRTALFALSLALTLTISALQGGEVPVPPFDYPPGADTTAHRTMRDLPGDYHKYYGQRRNQFRDVERRIAKIDLDADLNYDGVVSNEDPADGGAFEQTPPGLVIGEGEISQLIVRIRPYRVDYEGSAVVTLEVTGINRADRSGAFASFDQEAASTSHVRVWADRSRQRLLLDSADPTRRFYEWSVEDELFPANIPNIVPRAVYVEGVSANGSYTGDMRILLTVSHRSKDEPSRLEAEEAPRKTKIFKRFRTAFDHILVTVSEQPQHKEFVRNNSDGVWSYGGVTSGGK